VSRQGRRWQAAGVVLGLIGGGLTAIVAPTLLGCGCPREYPPSELPAGTWVATVDETQLESLGTDEIRVEIAGD
jgi:hypothetical protein